jgi:hypothetical protein
MPGLRGSSGGGGGVKIVGGRDELCVVETSHEISTLPHFET